ncbi:MAG: GNAT family N-acetyltransferase [Pseudomonadota bacterium]
MEDKQESRLTMLSGAVFSRAPRLLAILTFLVGSVALISAAIPPEQAEYQKRFERVMAETPMIGLTLGGLVLMALSLGLSRRLQTAWVLTLIAAMHGVFATAVLRPRPLEMAMYLILLAMLIWTRKAFYRRSSLQQIVFSRTWFLAALLAIVVAGFFSLLWVSHQTGFVEARFIDLLIDPVLGVAGRPIAFALFLLGMGAFYLAVASPFRTRPPPAGDADFERLSAIAAKGDAPRPENALAYVGDKSIFYGPDGDTAMAYADISGVRIAMGPPIGPRQSWKPTLEAFRKAAEAEALRPAIYAAPPELLPDLLDLSFTAEKIGENAILDLPEFSLSGRKREVIRRSRRKLAERAGATFELSVPPHSDRLIERLSAVSDAWLKANGGKEKSFSLGRFERGFLDRCPIGVVFLNGQPVAFGTLLVTPDTSWAGIDLMRYDPETAITNTMDFLLVELILWAKSAGYQKFDLSMAPLSGLVQAEFAPLYARIGHFVFERGERFYNFQGLRRFKHKFNPVWEPRYVAAPGYWSLPIVLAQAAMLTNNTSLKRQDMSELPPKAEEA